jgi:hypothetical protein
MNNENSPCDPIYHGILIDLTLIQKNAKKFKKKHYTKCKTCEIW